MNDTYLGGGSPLNKFSQINEHLTRNSRTVYVEADGNDIKGDGSQVRPFNTIKRALSEAVGTTSILTISLGEGSHALTGKTTINSVNVTFIGEGMIDLDSAGEFPFSLINSMVTTHVNINDVSTGTYSSLAVLDAGSIFAIRAGVVSLVSCTYQLFLNGTGHNGYLIASSTVQSNRAIVKAAANTNSAAMSDYIAGATLTNIT